jgi:hypothetical protein
MANPTYRQILGLAKETTWGTPVVATSFFPTRKPSGFVPQYEDLLDDYFRNNASDEQAYYQGVGLTPFDSGEMLVWPDDSLHFLMALFGVDTISGAGPYTHPITLLNTADPPSYTLTLFDNLIATARRISGAQITEVLLKWSTKGKLTMQVKGIGKVADTVTKPTETFSAASPFLGWQYTASVSGANTRVEEGEILFKRDVQPVYGGAGTQDMNQRMIDSLNGSGFLTFAVIDDTEKGYYTGNTQPAVSIVFTSGTNVLTLQMSKCAFVKGSDIDRGSLYSKVRLPFKAIANATDAGTGNAPAKIIGVNGKSTAY